MNPSRVDLQKNRLRRLLRRRLGRLTKAQRERKSQRILTRLMKTSEYKKAANIFTYIALPSEVQTLELIQKSLILRKRIFVPAIHIRKKEIAIFEIRNIKSDLKRGPFGISEPVKKRPGQPKKMDLVIVPGLGFDSKGRRLGRGEGYFDRFLPRTSKKAVKIGLAFREQKVRKIPTGVHDVSVDRVLVDL